MIKSSLKSNLCMAKYTSKYTVSLNITDLAISLHSLFMAKREEKNYFRPEAVLVKEQINCEARQL